MQPKRKYKVSVEKTITKRFFYTIDAPHDDSDEFYSKMNDCMANKIKPDTVEEAMEQGQVLYDEIFPNEYVEERTKTTSESVVVEVTPDPASPPPTYVSNINPNLELHVCPDSKIPYLADKLRNSVNIAFDFAEDTEGRDELIEDEDSPWDQAHEYELMAWMEKICNLSIPSQDKLWSANKDKIIKHIDKDIAKKLYGDK